PPDRSADAGARRVDEVHRVPRCDATGPQRTGDVVALQPLAGVLALGHPAKGVAPLPQDHVDRHAARLGFRALPAGLGDDFLDGIRIDEYPAKGTGAAQRVVAHALDPILAVGAAPVNRHRVDTVEVAAADVAVATGPVEPPPPVAPNVSAFIPR